MEKATALKTLSPCEECGQHPFKYRCPGCSLRSCSLPCVKAHKQRTNCTGKRNRTQFVPLSQFNDNTLISDYNLLEETKRVADSARLIRCGLFSNSGFRIPFKLKQFINHAGRRKTRVLILPSGMSKRMKNQSFYNPRKKSIFWTIEWQFHSTDVILIDHRVDEHMVLQPVIEKHLDPGSRDPQSHSKHQPFSTEQLGNLKFLIRKNSKDPKSPFRELNIKASLNQQLANIVLVEYPIIHVVLPLHIQEFKIDEVKNSVVLAKLEPAEPSDDLPSPKGVLFREEEIEEQEEEGREKSDSSSGKQVSGIMNHANPELAGLCFDERTGKEVSEDVELVSSSKLRAHPEEETDGCFEPAAGIIEDMDFDFEEVLGNACSSGIGQVNSDDFLGLGNGLFVEGELEGRKEWVLEEFSTDEAYEDLSICYKELEEGEIPDC